VFHSVAIMRRGREKFDPPTGALCGAHVTFGAFRQNSASARGDCADFGVPSQEIAMEIATDKFMYFTQPG
jgi:hypothetical protein